MIDSKKLKLVFPILLVFLFSMLLLLFIGYGEAKRTYPKFMLHKMNTQGEILRNAMSNFLNAGLPIEQYSGFSKQASSLLKSDSTLSGIFIFDAKNKFLHTKSQNGYNPQKEKFHRKNNSSKKTKRIFESDDAYRILIPLENKFGLVGYIAVDALKEKLFAELEGRYFYSIFGLILFLGIFIFAIIHIERSNKERNAKNKYYKIVFSVLFFLMTVFIASIIFTIYSYGARAKTKALSDSMGQRLATVIKLGIDLKDINNIQQTFDAYKKNNPDINAIVLTRNNIAYIHTNPTLIGKPYHNSRNNIEYIVDLPKYTKGNFVFRVAVTIPYNIVLKAIANSAKNFIVLFVATLLIAVIFLDAATSLIIRDHTLDRNNKELNEKNNFETTLNLIKAAYFIIVFVNALSVSFLPPIVQQLLGKASTSTKISLPFTIYYLVFALVLIPAGSYAERGKLKNLLYGGFIGEAIGLTIIALTNSYLLLTIARIFSGAGQGLFLIGLQSYILSVTPEDKRTQGQSVKVIGRNAGLISGAAIGGLLFAYIGYQQIFMIASIISLFGIGYLMALITDSESSPQPSKTNQWRMMLENIRQALADSEFTKTLVLIGLVGKIAISGVVMFAVPLILVRLSFSPEDIGLALMIFYISSMTTSKFTSQKIDKMHRTKGVLILSAMIGGISLVILGFTGVFQEFGGQSTLLRSIHNFALSINHWIQTSAWLNLQIPVFLALILAGIANGLLAAPIITHITRTTVAHHLGNKSTSATYIFLERFGHVIGPVSIAAMFSMTSHSNIALVLFGLFTIVAGILFKIMANEVGQ